MNINEYVSCQLHERYKTFIICGSGLTGKTQLVKKVAEERNGLYLDVLHMISSDEQLKSRINAISPEQLMKMIDVKGYDLIIADQLDIVFSLWSEAKQREFIRRLDKKSHGSCIIVVLHNYKLLEQSGLMEYNSRGDKRIINIAELS